MTDMTDIFMVYLADIKAFLSHFPLSESFPFRIIVIFIDVLIIIVDVHRIRPFRIRLL